MNTTAPRSSIYIPTTTTMTMTTTTILQSHSSVFCLLVRAYTAAAFACGRLSLYRPPHAQASTRIRMSHLQVASLPTTLTHKYTCLNAIIFRLLNSTIRFSLSLSCSGLCMSLCVRLMYINTISGPLAYNTDRRTEPYTTAALRKDLKRFVVTILRMK